LILTILRRSRRRHKKGVPPMSRINKDAAAQLVASICREKLWATPEETAAWLKTETGQRIAVLIEKERRSRK